LQKVLPILCTEIIADTNTDTFAKGNGDTFTPIHLPILLMLLLAIMVFKSSVCEDHYFVKHDRGSNEYTRNIIELTNQLKMQEV